MKRTSLAVVLTMLTFVSVQAQSMVDFQNELNRLLNINELPRYIDGTVVKQISSYDTTGGNNDGFGGTYSYIRKEPTGGLVIFEHLGQGVIERIWTPTPTDDTLDFYFDGEIVPSLSVKFRDMFNNSKAPFLAPIADQKVGGFYSYVPLPFAKGCKIVFRGEKILFHQIQFRTYDKRYKVKTYNNDLAEKQRPLLDKIIAQWRKSEHAIDDFGSSSQVKVEKKVTLLPGSTQSILELNSGGRLLGMELSPSEVFSGIYKNIDLKVTWDKENKPAVYVPVADFFGFAYGSVSMKSLLLGTAQNKAYCYIPMPFDKNAKVELVYRSGGDVKPVTLTATLYYTREKRDAKLEGKFYAYWKNENPALGTPYVFLEGNGRGHYVGTIMQGQATDYTNFTEFFEGDDYTAIDGKMTIHGTGSEDYFNGGWYAQPGGWVERLGAPLSGCLDYSLPLGRTGGYRLFISDKMPFNKSILHTIEHGPEKNNRLVNYISVAMYYSDKAIATQAPPVNALTKVFTPDTVTFYTRLMDHLTYSGDLHKKDEAGVLPKDGEGQLHIDVSEIPAGAYHVYMHRRPSGNMDMKVKTHEASQWQTIRGDNENDRDLFIGELFVHDNASSVSIQFKSSEGSSDLVFERISLAKKSK